MKINKNIEIVDLALFLIKEKTLVIGDLHIGFEESLNKEGVLVPRFQFNDLKERMEKILKKTKPEKIVINGDLKHEFGKISDQEWRETLKIITLLSEYSGKIILVKGNHDKTLGPIAEKKNIELKEEYLIGEVLVCHGHKIPTSNEFKSAKTIIIGHEHPAVSIRDGPRVETFKCFLAGKYEKKELILMPSFNLITEGTDLLKEELLSPFLKQKLDNFEVYIVADKVYPFGKLKNLK